MARTYYTQRKKGYEKIKLGFGPSDLYNYGCFVVSLANLSDIDPIEVNYTLKTNGGFSGDLVVSSQEMAKSIGLDYYGKSTTQPSYRTIAEVDMSPAPGKQQHFVVVKPDGSIIDPWTGDIRAKGTYPIVSYRLFKRNVISETEPAPVEEVSGDKVEIVEEEPKTPQKPISEVVEEIKESPELKYDPETQKWVWESSLINFNNIMEQLKAFFENKTVKTGLWNILGTFLGILATYLADISPQYSIILVPAILATTKYINKTYCTK